MTNVEADRSDSSGTEGEGDARSDGEKAEALPAGRRTRQWVGLTTSKQAPRARCTMLHAALRPLSP